MKLTLLIAATALLAAGLQASPDQTALHHGSTRAAQQSATHQKRAATPSISTLLGKHSPGIQHSH